MSARRSQRILGGLLVVLMALAPARPSGAHKFYASLSQIERTAEGRLEVGIRFFPDDLEQALTDFAGRKVRIDDAAGFKDALLRYLAARLVVSAGDTRATWEFVGIDARVNVAWVFVDASWPRPLKGARVVNRLLLEVSPEQVNTVNFTEGRDHASLTFTADRTEGEAFAPAK